MKKVKPKKVFVISENGYIEIPYGQLSVDHSYKDKYFIMLHGMLLEVTRDHYLEYHRTRNRQRYLRREHIRRRNISYDAFDTDEYRGVDYIVDEEYDVAEEAIANIMVEHLTYILNLLDDHERTLIYQHFFEEIPQTELAKIYGVNQSNISRRIKNIIEKLKKLLKY